MSISDWLKRNQRQQEDLDSGRFLSLNLEEKAKSTAEYQLPEPNRIVLPHVGPWNRKYLLLMVALIPLVISLLTPIGTADFGRRFARSVSQLPLREQARVLESLAQHKLVLGDVIMLLPDRRIEGAHLRRDTWVHWLYAVLAGIGYLVFLNSAFPPSRVTPHQLLSVGFFTGTIGILLLLGFEIAAALTQGVWVKGFGILTVLFYIVKFIGYSYASALDSNNGFLLSFMGFTFGVGFCEEVCKMLPVAGNCRSEAKMDWRGVCLLGMASGVGFGVSEGITYASEYYNGLQSADIYAVRFISCVALHGIWSCSAAVTLFERHEWLRHGNNLLELLWRLLQIVAVPMILHGLYDTLLKKEMRVEALVVAVVSFAWMIFQLERARRKETPVGFAPGLVSDEP